MWGVEHRLSGVGSCLSGVTIVRVEQYSYAHGAVIPRHGGRPAGGVALPRIADTLPL